MSTQATTVRWDVEAVWSSSSQCYEIIASYSSDTVAVAEYYGAAKTYKDAMQMVQQCRAELEEGV